MQISGHKLVRIAELNQLDLSYEFNILGAFKSELDGQIYWGNTQGCSCPSPYDEFTKIEDFSKLENSMAGWEELHDAVTKFPADETEKVDFMRAIAEAQK